ncbi:DUF1217 domain-containing protein [Roseibium sp.]|uniref:DUF1217 domain-containing protein n=1 Tax=Roseibium sp. TaxID=1936156 RepID=UPI003A973B7D
MISTLLQYQIVTGNLDRSLEVVSSEPTVERATEYYLQNIGEVKSIDEFLEDDRLFSYAMKAHGLEDMTYAKAFMRKALEEGVDDRRSFANMLADTRYREFVETYNFTRYGETATIFSRAQEGTAEKYARQTLEQNEGASNEGVRLALYFSRKAPDINSAYDILADKALAQTIYTALGLPSEFAMSDIDKQVDYISDKIDIEKLSDPEYLNTLLERFSTLYDLENGTGLQTVPSLMVSSSATGVVGIGESLLASIQGLKLGGA